MLIIIDPTVPAYFDLINGAIDNAQVLVLNPDQDGIAQITQVLASSKTNPSAVIQSVHIVSHGQPGALHLGNATVNGDTLPAYAEQLRQWSQVSEILIYGCRVAAGELGRRFVRQLHELTQGAIAASSTLVGQANLGGNWHLDVQIGGAPSRLAFHKSTLSTYAFTLPIDPTLPNLIYNIVRTSVSGPSKVLMVNINDGTTPDPVNPLTGTSVANVLAFYTQANARDPLSTNGLLYYVSTSTAEMYRQ